VKLKWYPLPENQAANGGASEIWVHVSWFGLYLIERLTVCFLTNCPFTFQFLLNLFLIVLKYWLYSKLSKTNQIILNWQLVSCFNYKYRFATSEGNLEHVVHLERKRNLKHFILRIGFQHFFFMPCLLSAIDSIQIWNIGVCWRNKSSATGKVLLQKKGIMGRVGFGHIVWADVFVKGLRYRLSFYFRNVFGLHRLILSMTKKNCHNLYNLF
jgi:hypothetical protein